MLTAYIRTASDLYSRPTTRNTDTFGYNEHGEVVSAQIGASQFAHAYDFIGNQTNFVANSATNSYTHNALNQISTTQEISAPSAPPREISHDLDGNLTNDTVFAYSYDAANRLSTVSSNGIVVVSNQYDYRGRRIRKTTPTTETTFVYDGWNLIHETISTISGTTTNITEIQYFWGADLSNTLQGAGGVGGLLAVSINGDFYFPAYDNNGNITKYIDENGNVVAEYTYDAFGKAISQSGSLADFFRHRFSSKYYDSETGLYYYGYRFYSPTLMRWLNRDPIEEQGGLNLYGFCGNSSVYKIDLNGCGTWAFGIPSPWGNSPDFTVSYELDEKERKCCKGVKVLRYVRKFITGGQVGPYFLDGNPEDFVEGTVIGYAPDDWPEGPGIGWWNKVYYRISWSWDFKFEAVCTGGNWKGKTLSASTKLYWADGHKPGETDFYHGFFDRPQWWPDLTVPSAMR